MIDERVGESRSREVAETRPHGSPAAPPTGRRRSTSGVLHARMERSPSPVLHARMDLA